MAWLDQLRMVRVREEMFGAYGPDEGREPLERVLSLSLSARARDLPTLARARPVAVDGLLRADGLCGACATQGSIRLERGPSLLYELTFVDQGQRLLRLRARRRLSLRGVPVAITVVRGRICQANGRAVARVTLRIDPGVSQPAAAGATLTLLGSIFIDRGIGVGSSIIHKFSEYLRR